jgi:Leucine-rich repeat (LRR) protein
MDIQIFIEKMQIFKVNNQRENLEKDRILLTNEEKPTHLWLTDYNQHNLSKISEDEIANFISNMTTLEYLSIIRYPKIPLNFLCSLNHLKDLLLKYSSYRDLPFCVNQLQRLKNFNGDGNRFLDIPEGLLRLPNLETLYLNDNLITNVPDSLIDWKSLRLLELRGNLFNEKFPKGLLTIPNLESLHLGGCCLTTVPEEIYQLKKITYLNLGSNRIKELPDSIWELPKLETLYLRNNQIDFIPESVLNLPNLKFILIEGNPCFKNFLMSKYAKKLNQKGVLFRYFQKEEIFN